MSEKFCCIIHSVHWVGLCVDDLEKLVKKLSVLHANLCMMISTDFRYAEETWKTPVDLSGTVYQLWSCWVREILWVPKRYASLVLGEYDKEHVQKLLKRDLHFLLLTDICCLASKNLQKMKWEKFLEDFGIQQRS